jgi:beta-lactamase regulating signal transducer with metallopeptidase domain
MIMTDFFLNWSITYLAHSTILIAAVWLVTRWLRSPVWCDLLWKLALVGGIVTATLVTILPARILDQTASLRILSGGVVSQSSESAAAGPLEVIAGGSPAEAPTRETMSAENLSPGITASDAMRSSLLTPLQRVLPLVGPTMMTVWGAGAALFLLRLLLGHRRLMKRLSNRREVVTGDDFELMQKLRLHDPMAPVRLSTADGVQSPITMLGSEIVLPRQTFERLTTAQKRSILAHELAHVRRLDPHWLCAAETICALLFLQPLNRLVRREMHLIAEFLCDDAALRQTGDRRALAETLAELAATISPMRPMTVAAMAEGGSNLFRRVRRVLSGANTDHTPIRFGAKAALVIVPILAISLLAPRIDAGMDFEGQSSDAVAETNEERPASTNGETITVRADEPEEKAPAEVNSPVEGRRIASTSYRTGGESSSSEFNTFDRGLLNRSFDGPEGETSVEFRARAAEVAIDGTSVRLLEPDGFVLVTQVSTRGPKREVEVTAGENLRPKYVYRVDGERHAWCSDAERVIASSSLGAKAYEPRSTTSPIVRESSKPEPKRGAETAPMTSAPPAWNTRLVWKASVSNSENSGGELREVRVNAQGFHYNPNSGEIWIEPGGYVEVEERRAGGIRSFHRTAGTLDWRGNASETRQDREAWLVKVLTANSSLPPRVIRSLARG